MAEKRFLTLADVGEVLNISSSQTYAIVRSGELPAIQVGGRGQWRVEASKLEDYISDAYERTAASIKEMNLQEAEETNS
ncbi:DNA binding domain-containing protein, excisionase family [Arthrobacter subterraneus]|uniref:DNA binding domain-containing protein, excisionase family n=1 Tax=Arthrobacter subterraneus TaxID=335973 RepID=A0A1G8Q683_9MICC|nr:helix-turn-helix domain-containing protein [Arthrobacter subterraneus]SDJ00279.1 DNA binding domain-containing protein, excisionase family [Arthrobacter subterraneus]